MRYKQRKVKSRHHESTQGTWLELPVLYYQDTKTGQLPAPHNPLHVLYMCSKKEYVFNTVHDKEAIGLVYLLHKAVFLNCQLLW